MNEEAGLLVQDVVGEMKITAAFLALEQRQDAVEGTLPDSRLASFPWQDLHRRFQSVNPVHDGAQQIRFDAADQAFVLDNRVRRIRIITELQGFCFACS